MCEACSTHAEKKNECMYDFGVKARIKETARRPRLRWEHNVSTVSDYRRALDW
jgi:hypothetical protein